MTDISDRNLVVAFAQHRDERSFLDLHRRHTPYLVAMAWRLTGGPSEAVDDLVEAAWVRACEVLPRFQWRSSFRTWITGILIHCHKEAFRRKDTSLPLNAAVDQPVRPESTELRIDLERALAKLSDGFREVVVLYHVYGYKHGDIAAMLGISESTSRSQLTRGLQRLRTLLSPADPAKGSL